MHPITEFVQENVDKVAEKKFYLDPEIEIVFSKYKNYSVILKNVSSNKLPADYFESAFGFPVTEVKEKHSLLSVQVKRIHEEVAHLKSLEFDFVSEKAKNESEKEQIERIKIHEESLDALSNIEEAYNNNLAELNKKISLDEMKNNLSEDIKSLEKKVLLAIRSATDQNKIG